MADAENKYQGKMGIKLQVLDRNTWNPLTVSKQKRSGLFKILQIIYIWNMYI